jgi:anti-sigma regulatory factor (Ser/Thr protein kinase)
MPPNPDPTKIGAKLRLNMRLSGCEQPARVETARIGVAPDPRCPLHEEVVGGMAGTRSGGWPTASDRSRSDVSSATLSAALDLTLPCTGRAPALAREALRRWIAGLGCTAELVDNAALLVSEAVTNAVVHAHSEPRLLILTVGDRLRIEVHDTSHIAPVMCAPGAGIGGNGLRILAVVADTWGWSTTTTGKLVWTEQRLGGSP